MKSTHSKYKKLKTKLLWTILYLLVFLIGRNIAVPLLYGTFSSDHSYLTNAANIATGADSYSASLFSLGLGPWMGATIIWRFLMIDRIAQKRRITQKTTNYARTILMLFLAILQAISFMSHYNIKAISLLGTHSQIASQILIVLTLVTGSFFVVWLANRNQEKGLGGMTVFIMIQIVISSMRTLPQISNLTLTQTHNRIITFIVVLCILVFIISILLNNSEYRIHLNKVGIDNGHTGLSYVPIKLNPAGAMPIMYAMTLLILPQYIFQALTYIFPELNVNSILLSQLTLSHPVGFVVYLVLLFTLSLFFGMFTISPKTLSEQMKHNGDYFDFIYPGLATRKHLENIVLKLSIVSGVVLCLLVGLPLILLQVDTSLSYLYTMPGTIMIFVFLVLVIQEEVADLFIDTKYRSIFFDDASNRKVIL